MLSVASCSTSTSQTIRKRRNNSDCESPEIKIPKEDFYFVLESESDIGSSEEDTESILSIQNKSTDFVKDTSDTSSKASNYGSDFGVEYEVVSLSEPEPPFGSCSSVSEMAILRSDAPEVESGSDSSVGQWADGSSAATDQETPRPRSFPLRLRRCIRCNAISNMVQYCSQCYKVRKDFFPPRPKNVKKKYRKNSKPKLSVKEQPKQDNCWVESSSSQEVLTPTVANSEPEGVCSVCFKAPRNGAFLHNRWVHIYCCYQCSLKIWFSTKACPLCHGKIRQVLKVAMSKS